MKINNVEHLKNFKDIKEISEIIDEIKEIEKYQQKLDAKKTQEFLDKLSIKYLKDKAEYNALHLYIGTTLEENLHNAKQFLFYKANKILAKKIMGVLENEK